MGPPATRKFKELGTTFSGPFPVYKRVRYYICVVGFAGAKS